MQQFSPVIVEMPAAHIMMSLVTWLMLSKYQPFSGELSTQVSQPISWLALNDLEIICNCFCTKHTQMGLFSRLQFITSPWAIVFCIGTWCTRFLSPSISLTPILSSSLSLCSSLYLFMSIYISILLSVHKTTMIFTHVNLSHYLEGFWQKLLF